MCFRGDQGLSGCLMGQSLRTDYLLRTFDLDLIVRSTYQCISKLCLL